MDAKLFQDKAVVVTGAGIGIGYAICQAFARAGALVALNDVEGNVAELATTRLNNELGEERLFPYTLDIADVPAVEAMMEEFALRTGRLDIVCANAGITNYGRFLDYTPDAFDRLTAVNMRGSYFTAQAAARKMIALGTKNGRIICTSSVTGVQAYPNLSAYGMTKAALIHMVAVLNAELGQHNITVNSVSPGAILTERTLEDDPNYEANWAGVIPTGRVGYVADVANAVLFLASPGAAQIGGQTIVVDGGWTRLSSIPDEAPAIPDPSTSGSNRL